MVVIDEEEFRRLPDEIAVYRAGMALARGDVAGTMQHARRALELSPEDDHLGRASAAGLLGLAFWASGDLDAAHRRMPNAWPACRGRGTSLMPRLRIALADILSRKVVLARR